MAPTRRGELYAACTALVVSGAARAAAPRRGARQRARGRPARTARRARCPTRASASVRTRPSPITTRRAGATRRGRSSAFAVAIGDSQTYGDEVSRQEAWPQRLAELTGRSVYNMALGGYGPVEYERLLPEALALSPQVVLVGLYAGNDLADAYLSAYPRALAPELRSDDPALLRALRSTRRRGELKDAWERTRDARKGRRFSAPARMPRARRRAARAWSRWRAPPRKPLSGSNGSRDGLRTRRLRDAARARGRGRSRAGCCPSRGPSSRRSSRRRRDSR